MDKKYRYGMLMVEITRRCNKRCEHCFRGDPQDKTITEDVIDRIFDEALDVQRVVLGSGEPLLEIQKIEYFVDKLVESTWTTIELELTTNGTVRDNRIIDILEKFCINKPESNALIRISNDQFHDKNEYEAAHIFYKNLADQANERILAKGAYGYICVKYTHPGGKLDGINYEGRAVRYIDEHTEDLSEKVGYSDKISHRIKVVDEIVPCALHVLYNGDLSFLEEVSYQNLDLLSFGNICRDSMSGLIDKHNHDCMILCSESDILKTVRYQERLKNYDMPTRFWVRASGLIFEQIIKLREYTRAQFPDIPAQYIILRLPFPTPAELETLFSEIYPFTTYYTKKLVDNIEKYRGTNKENTYKASLWLSVAYYLEDASIDRKYPYWLFGNNADIQAFLQSKFEKLNKSCKNNPQKQKNDRIFYCNVGDGDIISYRAEKKRGDIWEKVAAEHNKLIFSRRLESVVSSLPINQADFLAVVRQEYEKMHDNVKSTLAL